MSRGWDGLPADVRDAVSRQVGPVLETRDILGGQSSDVAAVLTTCEQKVFLKGVDVGQRGDPRRMRWLRNEADAGRLAAGVAPAILFDVDVAGWLAVGFEYVPGRDARLGPSSDDLTRVAETVDRISALPAPDVRKLRDRWRSTDWWHKAAQAAPDLVVGDDLPEMARWASMLPAQIEGDRLIHTDLHGGQFIVGDAGTVHVVDWGWPASGPEWIDTAFLVIRLVEAGHEPASAEEWARSLRSWSAVDDAGLNAFAAYVAGLWTYRAATTSAPGAARRSRTAREYAAWRIRAKR